ncbi:MAG: MBL fold metallo-hydrolase [Terracidiphilus sp.]
MRILSQLAMIGSAQFGLSSRLDCHMYAVRSPEGVVLVDAGSGLGEREVAAHLEADFPGVAVAGVILTHSHMDHSGGAEALRMRFGCKLFVSEETRPILESADEERSGLRRAREMGGYPEDLRMKPCAIDCTYQSGEAFEAGGRRWRAVRVRGHSNDSYCLMTEIEGRNACFSGDVVFYGGVLGVINSWDSDLHGYVEDLPRLTNAKIDILLPGHGLFTLKNGQRHVDAAIRSLDSGFLPRQIGQGAAIF